MTSIRENIEIFRRTIPQEVTLVAVSKYHTIDEINAAYEVGERDFGESRVQELQEKQPHLPSDIRWHFIGHLQRNKVKFIVPFVSLIHSVDSIRLLRTIDREANKIGKTVRCLLQVHIADEETKYGFVPEELHELLRGDDFQALENVEIVGLMGMATYTDDQEQVRAEFTQLRTLHTLLQKEYFSHQPSFCTLSMGMSQDYTIAIEEGSTMIRIGTALFGERAY